MLLQLPAETLYDSHTMVFEIKFQNINVAVYCPCAFASRAVNGISSCINL